VALALGAAAGLVALIASLFDGTPRLVLLCAGAAIGGGAANAGLVVAQRTAARMARDAAALRGAFAWLGLAPPIANLIGPVAAGATAACAGLLAFTAAAVLLARAARTPPVPAPGQGSAPGSVLEVLRHPTVRRMMVVDLLITGGWDVHGFVVPTLGHARGPSATAIGAVYGLVAIGVAGVRMAIPWLAHRLRAWVLCGSMLASAAVYALYPLGESTAYMGACALALGVAIGAAQPMVLSAMHQAVDERHRGGVLALRTMWDGLGSVTVPVVLAGAAAALGPAGMLWAVGASVAAGSVFTRRRSGEP
jgi:hypothetical protein